MTSVLSEQEISQAASLLSRLKAGFLPSEIFNQTTRLCTTATVELVPLRRQGALTEILLLRRPVDDPNWPSQLHSPGTVIRPTDVKDGLKIPIQRICTDELKIKLTTDPILVETFLHRVVRGTELATVLYADLDGIVTPQGNWYNARELPENMVATQREFIMKAVNAFERSE